MFVSDDVSCRFKEREEAVIKLIRSSRIPFIEIGLFGSYARGDYKVTSDIDFCIIVDNKPERRISGLLREEAESLGADIVYVTPDYFLNDSGAFARNLRRDYRRLIV